MVYSKLGVTRVAPFEEIPRLGLYTVSERQKFPTRLIKLPLPKLL